MFFFWFLVNPVNHILILLLLSFVGFFSGIHTNKHRAKFWNVQIQTYCVIGKNCHICSTTVLWILPINHCFRRVPRNLSNQTGFQTSPGYSSNVNQWFSVRPREPGGSVLHEVHKLCLLIKYFCYILKKKKNCLWNEVAQYKILCTALA